MNSVINVLIYEYRGLFHNYDWQMTTYLRGLDCISFSNSFLFRELKSRGFLAYHKLREYVMIRVADTRDELWQGGQELVFRQALAELGDVLKLAGANG